MSNRNAAPLDSNIGATVDEAGSRPVGADTAPTLDGRLANLDAERIRYTLQHVRQPDGSVHTLVRVNRDDEQRAHRRWLKRSTRSLRMLTLSRPLVAARATRAHARRSPRSRSARRATARVAPSRPGDSDPPLASAAEQLAARIASRIQAQRTTAALQRRIVAYLVALALIEVATLAMELAP